MSGIVSAICGQFSKSLFLGAFVPALLFGILNLIFVAPLLPEIWVLLKPLESLDSATWRVVAFSFAVAVLSLLLYNLNIPIIRFYEGYPWEGSWLGRRRVAHYQAQYDSAHARWDGLRTLSYALHARRPADPRADQVNRQWLSAGQIVNERFPALRSSVLPTRLGNVIRSFESYPQRQYRMSAIPLWPRLIARIDKDYAAVIDDAKTALDFTINSSMLSGLLGLSLLAIRLARPAPFSPAQGWPLWPLEVLAFLGLAYALYLAAISRAGAWGSMVKGAFDLYRGELLKQLGYSDAPASLGEERALWNSISQQILYGDSPRVQPPDFAPAHTAARGMPLGVKLELARGVSPPCPDGTLTVTISVRNTDGQGRRAQAVVVTDTLPDGLDYVWGSACLAGAQVCVSGANPYRFSIGDIDARGEALLSYRAVRRAS